MPRKPAHLEMIGGKSPRQRIWEAIRARRATEFIQADLVKATKLLQPQISAYLICLEKAGYLDAKQEGPGKPKHYRLARDNGIEAPRLTKDGRPATKGRINENLWRAMRIIGQGSDFNNLELAALATTPEVTINDDTAKAYITALEQAGYLEETAPATHGPGVAKRARYRLRRINAKTKKEPGPRPPIVQYLRTVYDPNIAQVIWREEPDLEALNEQ